MKTQKPVIVVVNAEHRGMNCGAIVEWEDGQQIRHLPCGVDDAAEWAREEFPEAKIKVK